MSMYSLNIFDESKDNDHITAHITAYILVFLDINKTP